MSITKYNPTTPGRRQMSSQDFTMVTKSSPRKSLTVGLKKQSGRDSAGHISTRHKGGGAKRLYRIIPFKLLEEGHIEVVSIEYDPNRKTRIALIKLPSGRMQYMLAPHGLKVNQTIIHNDQTPIKVGNRLILKNIPVGSLIFDIELQPNAKSKICRSAGSSATLLAIEGKYAMIKLPSGEIRQFFSNVKATIGQASNIHNNQVIIGKAGRSRLMGKRPTVRGKAMYPKAHPHGGGEGGSPIGMKSPKTKWGAKALGVKTRKPNPNSDHLIIRRRKKRR